LKIVLTATQTLVNDTIEDVIKEWPTRLNVPCIKDFPYGHGKKNCVLPIGANIILDADNRSVTL
jgi:muramoyltetrapeptide carboxypeptidase